uniref:Glu/Leu/Phe/Val dehydrogenase dimerization domain-containing protein n=1 Tax=uncultured Anaerotruncus sp. TaxID=905011 RepID=UPI00258693B0
MKIHVKSVAQSFLIKPVITVRLNGEERAWINCGDSEISEAADGENTLEFSTSLRKKSVRFQAAKDVSMDEVKTLGFWMTTKCAIAGLPYG